MDKVIGQVAVLAGGRSSRMGRDKALLEVGGMTMLERVVRVGLEVGERVVVLGERREGLALPVEWVVDETAWAGPMPAVVSLLERRGEEMVLLACDMPLVTAATVRLLVASHRAGGGVATMASVEEGLVEPALAVYTPGVVPLMKELMATRKGAFQPLARMAGVNVWRVPEDRVYECFNVNEKEALERARRRLEKRERPG